MSDDSPINPGRPVEGPAEVDPADLAGEGAPMIEGLPVPEVEVNDLQQMLAEGATLLDVREPDEVDEVRVPGGLRIPLKSLADRLDQIPSSGTLYVICAVGGRSQVAAEFLRDHGIDAVNVTGGTNAWVAADFPTESGPVAGADS